MTPFEQGASGHGKLSINVKGFPTLPSPSLFATEPFYLHYSGGHGLDRETNLSALSALNIYSNCNKIVTHLFGFSLVEITEIDMKT